MESSGSRASGWAFRDRWEWSILFLPGAAFLLLLLSQLWITDGLARAVAPPLPAAGDGPSFARGFVQISAAALIYGLICLAAVQYFWREIGVAHRSQPKRLYSPVVAVCCALIGVFGAALTVVHALDPSFFAISKVTLEPTIGAYGPATEAIGVSRLRGQLLVLLPNLAGIAAAVMGSLHAALVTKAAVADGNGGSGGNRAVPGGVPASLLNGMLVLSAVLIASVVLVTLHVHAHAPLYGAGASAAHEEFASFVAVVWGIGLSLIAALIYLPHLVLLGIAGRTAAAGSPVGEGGSGPRRAALLQKVEMALAIIGPVIIGVLTRVLEL